jgi:trigger factor
MNITKENVDKLNAVLSISLEKDDYENRVNDVLKDYRKKARIDGFRPGKVPFGLINKMYRKPVLVEEVNKLISESISNYLVEEKLHILGDPLPHEEKEEEVQNIDWDNDETFEFKFDLGIAPEVDVKLSPKDKYPFYHIKIDDALIDKYVDSYRQRFGEFTSVDSPEEKDMIKAEVHQLDSNNEKLEDGVSVDEVTLSIEMAKDAGIKKQLLKAKKDDILIIDLKKAYPSEAELSGMLKIDKEKVDELTGNFELNVKDITRFNEAEINQELFDKVFGPGTVKTEKEFRDKIAEEAKKGTLQDSEYRFRIDVKEILIKKTKFELPRDFLKRWLYAINKGKFTEEQIEKDFESFAEDLKWQLIKDQIMRDNQLEVAEEDVKKVARDTARMQFAQYGMANVPDEHLEEFARRMLEKEEDRNSMHSRAVENKVIDFVKQTVKVDEKEISSEKFNKLFEK